MVSLSVDFISGTLYFILETCQALSKQHYFSIIYIHQKILIAAEVTLTVNHEWQPVVTTFRALVTSVLSRQSLFFLSSYLHFFASTHHFFFGSSTMDPLSLSLEKRCKNINLDSFSQC